MCRSLAAAGAKVVLEVQAELTTLMARLDGAAAVIARGDAPPPFDVHCPLGSLPLAFKTEPGTVPAQIPYLSADDAHLAKWSARIGALPAAAHRHRLVGQRRATTTTATVRSRSTVWRRCSPSLRRGELRQHPARRARRGCWRRSPARAA